MNKYKTIGLLSESEEGFGVIVEWNTSTGSSGYVSSKLQEKYLNEDLNDSHTKGVFMTCILQKYDTENRNGRFYPKAVLEREDKKYQELISEGRALGQCDHPTDSTISLKKEEITHRVVKTWWEGSTLMGILEILTSKKYHDDGSITCQGDFIADLLRRGVKIGISSRGVGSLKNIGGKNIVQDDFELICYDLVASPSTPGAFLYPETEVNLTESFSNNDNLNNDENKLSLILNDFLK